MHDGYYRPLPIRVKQLRGPSFLGGLVVDEGNLSGLIEKVDCLRAELGFTRWSHIQHLCDDGSPLTTDEGGLERLYERLCVLWVNADKGVPDA